MHDWSGGEIQRAFEVQPKAADIATREVVCGLSRLGALIRCSISWLVAEALKSLSNDSDVCYNSLDGILNCLAPHSAVLGLC